MKAPPGVWNQRDGDRQSLVTRELQLRPDSQDLKLTAESQLTTHRHTDSQTGNHFVSERLGAAALQSRIRKDRDEKS